MLGHIADHAINLLKVSDTQKIWTLFIRITVDEMRSVNDFMLVLIDIPNWLTTNGTILVGTR